MVNLTKNQSDAVLALEEARNVYRAGEAALEAAIEAEREKLKAPVREAVTRAESLKVPTRRIHMALGFAQVGQLYNFLRPPKGVALGAPTINLTAPAQVEEPRNAVASWSETNDEDSDWPSIDVTDVDGTVIRLIVDIDRRVTDRTVISPNNGWYHYKGETKAEVQTAIIEFLTEQFGKPIEWE